MRSLTCLLLAVSAGACGSSPSNLAPTSAATTLTTPPASMVESTRLDAPPSRTPDTAPEATRPLPAVVDCLLFARAHCGSAELFTLSTASGKGTYLGFLLPPGAEIFAPTDGWYLGATPIPPRGVQVAFGARPTTGGPPGVLAYCPGPVFRVSGDIRGADVTSARVEAGRTIGTVQNTGVTQPGGYTIIVSLRGRDETGRSLATENLRELFPRAFAVGPRVVRYEPSGSPAVIVGSPIYLDPNRPCDTVQMPSPRP